MKLTLKNIKELKRNATPLEKRVLNYIVDEWGNYDDKKYIFTAVKISAPTASYPLRGGHFVPRTLRRYAQSCRSLPQPDIGRLSSRAST